MRNMGRYYTLNTVYQSKTIAFSHKNRRVELSNMNSFTPPKLPCVWLTCSYTWFGKHRDDSWNKYDCSCTLNSACLISWCICQVLSEFTEVLLGWKYLCLIVANQVASCGFHTGVNFAGACSYVCDNFLVRINFVV